MVFIFSILVLLYHGCSNSQGAKDITQVIYFFPDGLDPARNHDYSEYQIFSQIYEPLLQLGNDYTTLEPCLAESWSVSNNELDYLIHLRPDIKFHDGSALTAEVARFSMMRQINLRPDYLQFSIVDTIMVVDKLTLTIQLRHPYSPFLYFLASPSGFMIMSKEAIKKYGNNIDKNPSGTGPFFLDQWLDKEQISLKRFPEYRELSDIERVVFYHPTDNSESEVLFKEGKLDILYLVAGFWLDRLRWLGSVEYFVQKPLNTLFLSFNLKNSIMANRLIRKAILLAIDIKKVIIIANRGNALVADSPLPPVFSGFTDLKQESYNPEKSKKLLQAAGYEHGLFLNLYIPSYTFSRNTKIELIKSELEKVGINLKLTYFDSSESYHSAIPENDCQIFFDGYSTEMIGDPGNFLYALFHSSSTYNSGGYVSERIDHLLDKSLLVTNKTKRHVLYEEIVKNVLDDVPAVYMAHVKSNFAYNSQKIESIAASPYEFIYYHRLKLRN